MRLAAAALALLSAAALALCVWILESDGGAYEASIALAPSPSSSASPPADLRASGESSPPPRAENGARDELLRQESQRASDAERIYLGRIVDELGAPVPHAYVGLFTMPGWVKREVYRSDAGGAVTFVVPPHLEGTPWISCSCAGHQNQAFALAEFLARQPSRVPFVLVAPRGFRLHGIVRDDRGAAIPAVELRLDLGSVEPTRTDAAGRFHFPAGLPAGMRRVFCLREGYIPKQANVEIRAETPALELVLHPQRTMRGHVLDEAGAPLADLTIHALGAGHHCFAKSSADGSFAIGEPIPDAPPMFLEVRAGATEPYRSEHELAWGTTGILITLRAPLGFELHVSDAATRAPVEHFDVQLRRADVADTSQSQLRRGPHAAGKVVFEALLRGTWTVEIEPRDEEHAAPAPFSIVVADDVSRKHFLALERRSREVLEPAPGTPRDRE